MSDAHVVVVGAGLAGLVSAWEFAAVGMDVTVVDEAEDLADPTPGALILSPDEELGHFLETLGVVPKEARVARELVREGIRLPVPDNAVCGIPANVFAEEVRAIVGARGAWRAYIDRLRPPLTIGHEKRLGRLATARFGRTVTERLIEPFARAFFGADATDVDVDRAIPGLNAAMTRAGSLSGGVALLDRDAGLWVVTGFWDALVGALRDRGVVFRGGAHVERVAETEAEGLTAHFSSSSHAESVEKELETDTEQPAQLSADAIVIATGQREATRLLGYSDAMPAEDEMVWTAELEESVPPALIVFDEPRVRSAEITGCTVRIVGTPEAEFAVIARDTLALPVADHTVTLRRRDKVASRGLLRPHPADSFQPRPAIGIVGAWIAGEAEPISQSRKESQRLRSSLLWGESAPTSE